MNASIRTVSRRLLFTSLAITAVGVGAQTPAAGTPSNPTAELRCWEQFPCPIGTICGPGGGEGMSQVLTPPGLVRGGAYSPLFGSPLPTSPRMINNNLSVPDLRMLAPSTSSGMQVTRVTSTIYRDGAMNVIGQRKSIDFASGSLPAVSQVAQFALSPSVQGGIWWLMLDVQGSKAANTPKKGIVAASFQIACKLPVFVEQRVLQGF